MKTLDDKLFEKLMWLRGINLFRQYIGDDLEGVLTYSKLNARKLDYMVLNEKMWPNAMPAHYQSDISRMNPKEKDYYNKSLRCTLDTLVTIIPIIAEDISVYKNKFRIELGRNPGLVSLASIFETIHHESNELFEEEGLLRGEIIQIYDVVIENKEERDLHKLNTGFMGTKNEDKQIIACAELSGAIKRGDMDDKAFVMHACEKLDLKYSDKTRQDYSFVKNSGRIQITEYIKSKINSIQDDLGRPMKKYLNIPE